MSRPRVGGSAAAGLAGETYENEAFDLKSNRWVELSPMPTGRHGFGAAALGKYLYIASGARGMGAGDPTNALLAFSLP